LDWERIITEVWLNHRGKALGLSLGLLFGVLTAVLGFWETFFIAVCIIIGYMIGKKFDDNTGIRQILNKIFRER
jgi:uncharacterized membrane protein